MGLHYLAPEPQAGLARRWLAQGNLTAACASIEPILALSNERPLEGLEEPLRVYHTCYQILAATGDAQAVPLLTLAYTQLQARADRIQEPQVRASFLHNVAAHRALARHMTELLHGAGERAQAEAAAQALFSGDLASLSERTLLEVFASVPSSEHDKNLLSGGLPLIELLAQTTLVKSKREAREFLQSGSIAVNGRKVGPDDKVTTEDLLHGHSLALRRGKKNWHLTRWK